jgi:4-aminobutyrate aminotransferase
MTLPRNISQLKSKGDLNISSKQTECIKNSIGPEAQKWLEEDAKYFLHDSLSTPCLNVLAGCEGNYIMDFDGKRYLDFHGNNVHQVGFGNRKIIDSIKKQVDKLSFCTRRYTNIPAIQLARKLVELTPGDLNKVLFCPGGTSAVGIALKLARYATGKHKTISMWDSFHGASLDCISIGGKELFRGGVGPLLPGTEHVPPPDPDLKAAQYIEYVLEKEGDVGAVIATTMGSYGNVPSREFWQAVRASCNKHGALLILDEIPICLGRTGKMFACENYDLIPDMLVIGKGLGGGIFPLAALIARSNLNVLGDRSIGHYTHEKNPVACAAALATIEFIEAENLVERARVIGDRALRRMRAMQERHPLIGDVRGIGLLLGIELVENRETKERACEKANVIMHQALQRGISIKVAMGNIITLTPPLTINQKEIDWALDIIEDCIKETEGA